MAVIPPLRVLIVPRWGGIAEDDWYPWLIGEVGDAFPDVETVVAPMPDPSNPTIAGWVPAIAAAVGDQPARLTRTVLVGHSVGCQAALRFLDGLADGTAVAAFVAVAGWWTVDEPWDTLMPWIETPVDLERVRARAGRVTLVLSDNDPFTSDHVKNAEAWSGRVGATVEMAPGRAHMNDRQEPEVLSAILAEIERTLEPPATAGNPYDGEEQP